MATGGRDGERAWLREDVMGEGVATGGRDGERAWLREDVMGRGRGYGRT